VLDFIYFLGRFHVLVLHIPIGVIVAILVLEWLARKKKYAHLESAAGFLWGVAAVSAVVTVVLGYMHFAEGGFEGPSGNQHRTFGTLLAVLVCIAAALRLSPFATSYRPVFLPAAVLMFFLVSLVGHYGGNLTHGRTYLLEYAPQPLRSIAGLPPRRPPVTDLAMADPFLDIVGPILRERCTGCHNPDEHRGELDLTTHATAMRGGETGTVITPGRPEVSEMINRVTLPPDDDAFMPAEGNTPLTERQVEIVRWWIEIGAPVDTTLAQLEAELSDETRALLSAELGLEG
jgi:uncharacterized membrane protein